MNGMQRLACVLIVFSAAVVNAGDFGVGAWTRTATTSFTPDPQNLIAGMMPTDYNWGTLSKQEGSGNNETLTDGEGGFDAYKKKTEFGNSSYVCYHLGDAACGYMVTMVRLTTGSWASRDNATISSIQFKFVGSDDWETLPGSGVNHNVNSAGISTLAKTAEVDYLASGVTDIRINFGNQETSYVGYGEIEVCGTALDKVFGENYELADIVTGSKIITGSPTVALVGLVIPQGYNQWQQNESEDASALDPAAWVSLSTPPTTQTLTVEGVDADIKGCTWFGDSTGNLLPMLCRSSSIRYSVMGPIITAPSSITRELHLSGVVFGIDEPQFAFAAGSSSVFGAETIPLELTATAMVLTAGGNDSDPDPDSVRVTTAGEYVLTLYATNNLGVGVSLDIPVTVTEMPDYDGTITWTGATSTDPATASNWSPAIVPADGDAVIIPLDATKTLTLPAARYPVGGRYASFTVSAGATVICNGDTTTAKGFGPSVFADEMVIDGTVDANGKGFASGAGPGGSSEGAAHMGGAYGYNSTVLWTRDYAKRAVDANGLLLDDPRAPTGLGSGGSGYGGGAIRLTATKSLTLNGKIAANGLNRGAGGSIWLQTATLHGTGSASAKSAAYSSRAGGGGAIAVVYECSDFTGSWDVAGVLGASSGSSGECGTIYEPRRFARGTPENPVTVVLPFQANWVFDGGDYYWKLSTEADGAGVWLDGGTLHLGDHVQSVNGIKLGEWNHCHPNFSTAVVFDSLTLSGTAKLSLPPVECAPVVTFGSISISDTAKLYVGVPDTTGEHGIGQILRITGDCLIAEGGEISGDGRGPDATYKCYSNNGAPHGGAQAGGDPYGSAWAPITSGTVAASTATAQCRAGGAVKLEVEGRLEVNGAITCRPCDMSLENRSSSGSIFIETAYFGGSGKLDAGRTAAGATSYGGGGRIAVYSPVNEFSGNIVVQTAIGNNQASIAGTVFIESSANTSAYAFGTGPKLSCDYTQQSFGKVVYSDGNNVSASGVNQNLAASAMCCEREVSQWKRREMVWTEKWYLTKSASGATNVKVDNTATYSISSLSPNCQYIIEVNGSELVNADSSNGQFRTDGEGKLTFAADLANAENSISVCRNLRPMLLYLK